MADNSGNHRRGAAPPRWTVFALAAAIAGVAVMARQASVLGDRLSHVTAERDEFSEKLGKVESARASLRSFSLDYYGVDNLRLLREKDGRKRVVFYGDSITEFWDLDRFLDGLPYQLVNRGVKAQLTEHLLARLYFDVLMLRPWAVVLTAGTNDALKLVPEERIEQNLDVIIYGARRKGARVFVGTLPPVKVGRASEAAAEGARRVEATIGRVNAWIMSRCAGDLCTALDFHAALRAQARAGREPLLMDGLHPSPLGYAAMSKLARAALRRAGP